MTLKDKINYDFVEAFKNKETDKKNFLGVIKGEIQNEEGRTGPITDEKVLSILKKLEKSLVQTNTSDSLKELDVLKPYLPVMMSESRIEEIISNYVDNGLSNVGQIMGEFNKNFKGQADNKIVSEIVKKCLEKSKV
jgi:uncharacterized protein YqeY